MVRLISRSVLRDVALLILLTIACLAPFSDKAFHIDDPMYIWSAKHIQDDPFDFYGFMVNWDGIEKPMSEVMLNPPLTPYYIAIAGRLMNWSEIALHLSFLIPACALIIGIYFLAGKFCTHRFLTALIAICTPAFLVSGTSVTCDVMLAAWCVWGVFLWMHGLKKDSAPYLCLAGCCIAFAELTKYFGLAMIPLLLVYTLLIKRRAGYWLIFLMLPVLAIAAYHWVTVSLYDQGALAGATSYALHLKVGSGFWFKLLKTMAFTGGCVISVFFFAPLLWRRTRLYTLASVIGLLAMMLIITSPKGWFPPHETTLDGLGFVAQFSLLSGAGLVLLILSFADLMQSKNEESLLLCMWLLGTLAFAGFINWTISARNILPLVPPAAILLMRGIERSQALERPRLLTYLPLLPALLISLTVTLLDYRLANSARTAATVISQIYSGGSGALRFEGHWGFQYYLEKLGGIPFDYGKPSARPGDIIIIPRNNSYLRPINPERITLLQTMEFNVPDWGASMNGAVGAGFYSDGYGPLPFVFSHVPKEQYQVLLVK